MVNSTRWGGALLALLLATPLVSAYTWGSPIYCRPYYPAPDACGPGWYVVNPWGMVYGPNYYVYPPFPPVGGCSPANYYTARAQAQAPAGYPILPGRPGQPPQPLPVFNPQTAKIEFPTPPPPPPQAKTVYPTHPFVRSPRDYFMWNEALEEQEGRAARPSFVP
jgi:hypothetical protein